MMRTFTPLGILVLTLLIVIVVVLGLLTMGSIRYGGPQGLVLRVRAEIAAHQSHPQFVPTPLPTPTGRVLGIADPTGSPLQGILGATPERIPLVTPAVPQPQPTATARAPIVIPTQVPTSAPPPAPVHRPAQQTVQLSGFNHTWQKWNNCGPATLAMGLSYFGSNASQDQLAAVLKGNQDDKNVSPHELAAYARSAGFEATVRVNGNFDTLRTLLSNGIPVLIETWLEEEPNNGMGHYRLLTGYDDAGQHWTAYDSYVSKGVKSADSYQGILLPYTEMYDLWTVFNRVYMVIYTREQHATVLSILGQQNDDVTMWNVALQQTQAELQQNPNDAFAWFNLGTDLVALRQYQAASDAYTRARVIGLPWRMLWYQFGPFRAYYETGQYEELVALANATIATAGNIEETYYWKGLGLAAVGNTSAAREAWQRAIELNAGYTEATDALAGLDQSQRESRTQFPAGGVEKEAHRGV